MTLKRIDTRKETLIIILQEIRKDNLVKIDMSKIINKNIVKGRIDMRIGHQLPPGQY
jgi:hypothetical protein